MLDDDPTDESRYDEAPEPTPDSIPNRGEWSSELEAAPVPNVAALPPALTPRPAGFSRRAVAFAIDGSVLLIASVPLGLAGLAGVKCALLVLGSPTGTDDLEEALSSLLSLGWPLMAFVYFSVLHGSMGQTIGKALLGVRVLTTDLAAIGLGRGIVRTLAYLASGTFFGAGFLTIAFTPRKRGWHDYLAGTCVVRLTADEGRS